MRAHWSSAAMLWVIGAWIGWALLRDWPQATLVALLTPIWLGGEWSDHFDADSLVLAESALMLGITYLAAIAPHKRSLVRSALAWTGGILLIPCAFAVVATASVAVPHSSPRLMGWLVGAGIALALAIALRGFDAWLNAVAVAWVWILGALAAVRGNPLYFLWLVIGAAGLIAWGIKEGRRERINLGIAGFALTILFFYFSNLMDKLGRAVSLIVLGVLLLAGGWLLERTRRRLIEQIGEGSS
jgi:hypothetical protein